MKTYKFTMFIDVEDEAALLAAAQAHPDAGNFTIDSVEAALIVLLDPSTVPGCSISSSGAEMTWCGA